MNWRWKFEFVIEFFLNEYFWIGFNRDLIIEKHSIRAILTFSTNLTLCDSSLSILFYFPCVSQFHWSPVKIILAWIIEIVRQLNYYTIFMYYFLVFLSFLFIHCFVFILPISTILFVKFHLFVFLFIIFSSSFCKNDVSTTLRFSSIIIEILLFIFLFLRILNFLPYFLNYSSSILSSQIPLSVLLCQNYFAINNFPFIFFYFKSILALFISFPIYFTFSCYNYYITKESILFATLLF